MAFPNDTFWQPFHQSVGKRTSFLPFLPPISHTSIPISHNTNLTRILTHLSLGTVYVNSVLASLNFRPTEKTGTPAFPLGKRQPTTTLAEISTLQTSAYTRYTGNESTDSVSNCFFLRGFERVGMDADVGWLRCRKWYSRRRQDRKLRLRRCSLLIRLISRCVFVTSPETVIPLTATLLFDYRWAQTRKDLACKPSSSSVREGKVSSLVAFPSNSRDPLSLHLYNLDLQTSGKRPVCHTVIFMYVSCRGRWCWCTLLVYESMY